MGIYDRDYMREPETEPPLLARWPFWAIVAASAVLLGAILFLSPNRQAATTEDTDSATSEVPAPHSVNVNTASFEEIDALPYISPATAQAIIDGRPYKSPEDLLRIRGIKRKTLERIRNYIRLD